MNNQRAFPRFPLTLTVSVSVAGSVQICRVRDYCAGGMFLLYGPHPRPMAEGSDIAIQFTDPDSPEKAYQMVAKVARALGHGAGVSFTEPNQVALMVLAQLSQKQASSMQQQVKAQLGDKIPAIVRRCREIGAAGVQRMVDTFLEKANDRLFLAAQESKSNIQQSAFLGGINELQKDKDKLTSSIINEVTRRFDVLDRAGYTPDAALPGAEEDEEDGLSLVDSEEFDNWLQVRSIASKIEDHLPEELDGVETRLTAIAVNPISKESNPVGPLALASAFSTAIDKLTLEDDARKAMFLVMEGIFDSELKKLYDELNGVLIGHHVYPELKKRMEVVKKPGGVSRVASEPGGGAVNEPPQGSGTQGVAQGGGGAPQQAAPQQAAPQQAAPQQAAPQQAASQQTAAQQAAGVTAPRINYSRPAMAASVGGAAPMPAVPFQEVQELMQLRVGEVQPPPPNGYFSSGEVMQALTHLEGMVKGAERGELDAVGHANYLAQTLSQLTGEAGKGLSDADRDTVAYVGGLFTSMHHDLNLPAVARQWLESLEVPLIKAGVIDPTMVDDVEHPARQVVNRLEQVGRHVQSDKSETRDNIRSQVEALLEAIQKRVDEDPEVFAEAVGQLDRIREGYSAAYRSRVDEIIQQCQKESSLNRVRNAILDALNELLGHREVPRVILKLLDGGFKNLLFNTHLKEGPKGEAYQSYLGFIDLLTARLAKREPVKGRKLATDETLLQWLPRMLASASKDEARNAALVQEVKGYLTEEMQPAMQYVPALTIKATHLDELNSKPVEVDTDAWQLVLDDARSLEDGAAFAYEDEDKGRQELSLVWHDEADKPPRYVFADNSGEKSLDASLGEVANLLYSKALTRMEVRDLSVTERATYDFLQSIHNSLSHQAQYDELTGLMNRKSFERSLERAYNEAIASERSGVLGYFDLDRFNVINTTCGHSEGDKLLQEVAKILSENAGEKATVARLGGDEFGVILEGASRIEGLKRITALHDELRNIRFSCGENDFNVTASVGLAEINNNIESSGRLLSAVDAACFTAKDQGRDNVQIHNPENLRITNRTTILEWVGRINVLFEKNLIQLRCQKIDPVQKHITSLPHYEVLLDVMDEEGNKVPLDEFIVAAERYNRIIDIDTWVVNNVFQWLEDHRSKLSRINGLSINLSGSSMGNRKFMENLTTLLSEEGFPADKVIFEVTETIAINNIDNAARFMRKIKETGCQFSLDDFGSGTSSYSYLKTLPIDYLKIDGAFVKDIARNSHDYAVVKSINEIGHAMGKKTVAEYVEDEFAFQALKAIGLDYVQGFGIEKPIPLHKLFG